MSSSEEEIHLETLGAVLNCKDLVKIFHFGGLFSIKDDPLAALHHRSPG